MFISDYDVTNPEDAYKKWQVLDVGGVSEEEQAALPAVLQFLADHGHVQLGNADKSACVATLADA